MARTLISSGSPFEPKIGFSRGVRIGPVLAVSGTAPMNSDGTTHQPGDAYAQTKRCLEICLAAAEQGGAKITDVIRTRIMLTDIKQWEDAARAHGEFFSEVRPACTFVEVSGLIREDWLVEIEMDCVIAD